MIIHHIDMKRINEPAYSKVYEAKMLELLPEWEKYLDDPFGREDLMVKKTKLYIMFKTLRTFQIFYKPKSTPHFNDKKFTLTELLSFNLLEDKVVEAIKLKDSSWDNMDKVVKGINKSWKSKRAKSKVNGLGKNVRFYYGRIRP